MKSLMKKIIPIALSVAMVLGAVQTTPGAAVQADGSRYMKNLDLKWDLKEGKNLLLTANYPGIGKQKFSVRMTSYKLQDASKQGYKELTIGYKSTRKWMPTTEKVDKIINASVKRTIGDFQYIPFVSGFAVVDYYTGVSLEGKNDYDVTVKILNRKFSGTKKYKGTDGNWMRIAKTAAINIQITYPEDYKGVCIGLIGANTNTGRGKYFTIEAKGAVGGGYVDDEFFKATKWIKIRKDVYTWNDGTGTPFKYGQTSYYLQGRQNSHWLLVCPDPDTLQTPAPSVSPSPAAAAAPEDTPASKD